MASLMDKSPGASIMEIGCGTGLHSYILAKSTGLQVLGTDICGPFIETARSRYSLPNLRFETLDFNNRTDIDGVLKGRLFDNVVGDGILHHLYYNMDTCLANINRLLKPGGKIIFLEPNFFNPYCLLIFNVGIFRKMARLEPAEMTFTKKFIGEKLGRAGFGSVKTEYRDFLVPGIPDFLIGPSIAAGSVVEKIPLLNMTAQSLFISASKLKAL